jgi:hypothetical protein
MDATMLEALRAPGPSPELPPDECMYDWLIGSWNVRVVDHLDDGSKRESTGEWHFAYVLEGRAVQDVWISPPRSERRADTPKDCNRYGTSIRFFHPARRRWELTWINPVSGARDVLIARRQRNDISRKDGTSTATSSAGSSPTSRRTRPVGTAKRRKTAAETGPSGRSSF